MAEDGGHDRAGHGLDSGVGGPRTVRGEGRTGLAAALLRALLRLHPARFRKPLGEDLLAAFLHERDRIRREQGRLAARLWTVRTLLETLAGLPSVWLQHPPFPQMTTTTRERTMTRTMTNLRTDVAMLLRQLRQHPLFAAVVVGTLAVGIGATTTIYSVVRGVLLDPLPYPGGDRIAEITGGGASSLPNFRDLQERLSSMEAMGAFVVPSSFALTGSGAPVQLSGSQVTEGFFGLLGIEPTLGRFLGAADDQTRRVVLSHGLWTERLGGDPGVIGRSITLDDGAWQIVGVAPPEVGRPFDQDLWLPLQGDPSGGIRGSRAARTIYLYGRVAEGLAMDAARAELVEEFDHLKREHAEANAEWSVGLTPLRETLVGDETRPLLLLLAAAGLFLFIACANVASVFVSRLDLRRREFAVRSALGAGRRRLLAQAWTETAVLGLLGGTGGVLLAFLGVDAALAAFGDSLSRPDSVAIDARVLLFALVVSALTVLVVGTLWIAGWRDRTPAETLKRSSVAGKGSLLRRSLVVFQVAVSLVLVASLGLLVKSFLRVQAVELGVEADGAIALTVGQLPQSRYANGEARAFFATDLARRLQSLEGVEGVAATSKLPLSGCCNNGPVGRADDPEVEERRTEVRTVSRSFFEVVGIPLLSGRAFDSREGAGDGLATVISRELAERLFPGENPLGRTVLVYGNEAAVIGVVGDVREYGPTRGTPPAAYLSAEQAGLWVPSFVLRTDLDPALVERRAREVLDRVDPLLPVGEVRTLASLAADTTGDRRATTLLMALLGVLSVGLGAVGIYGVMSHAVNGQAREIGVRLALGATRKGVLGGTLWKAVRLVIPGIALGLLGVWAARAVLVSLLYEVSAFDPWVYTLAVAAFFVVALAAGLAPARRASRVEPVEALREG